MIYLNNFLILKDQLILIFRNQMCHLIYSILIVV